jgi:hypothetical protein
MSARGVSESEEDRSTHRRYISHQFHRRMTSCRGTRVGDLSGVWLHPPQSQICRAVVVQITPLDERGDHQE